jgi:dihydrofolate reductase
MSDLTVDLISSLDGFAAADGWPGWWGLEGPEMFTWLDEVSRHDHTIVMGANTYRLMSGIVAQDHASFARINELPKVVFSSTLTEPLSWMNTRVVAEDAVAAVTDMKQTGADGPLRTMGSLSVIRSLLAAGLVDVFRVVVFPVITGATGQEPIYQGMPDLMLDMLSTRTLDGRLQVLEYKPTVIEVDRT